jgi:hypothetical protein
MSGSEPTWTDFRMEAFGDPYLVWHDGPDFRALTAQWKANRAKVEALLAAGLDQRDPLAAKAIASLPLNLAGRRRMVALLADHLGAQPAGLHLAVAEAIFRLSGDESMADEIVRVLLGAGFWSDRLDAAIALRAFRPTQTLIDALEEGVKDPDYLVRYHSSNTLLQFAGLEPQITANALLYDMVRSDTRPAQWASAATELGRKANELIVS